jgi:prepilin-type N-terminal cleavage/methylation domain-containing protein
MQANSFHPTAYRKTNGFTLVELLVVIAIIALLVSLIIPGVSSVMSRARSVRCQNRLRSQGVAILSFANDHAGRYPTNGSVNPFSSTGGYGRYFALVGEYLAPGLSGNDLRNTPVYRCAELDSSPRKGQLDHFGMNFMVMIRNSSGTGFNNFLPTPLKITQARHPETTPVLWCVHSEGGGGMPFAPSDLASEIGYNGPTDPRGISPNHKHNCNILMLSGRVMQINMSEIDDFPYYGDVPTSRWPNNTVFDPTFLKQ